MTEKNDRYLHVSKRGVMFTLAAIGLLIAGGALASYLNQDRMQASDATAPKKVAASHPPHQQVAQAQPGCNDNNIVGTVVGGVGGGVVGSQVGRGSGKTAATIGGVLGGAYLGNRYIPTRNVTCK